MHRRLSIRVGLVFGVLGWLCGAGFQGGPVAWAQPKPIP